MTGEKYLQSVRELKFKVDKLEQIRNDTDSNTSVVENKIKKAKEEYFKRKIDTFEKIMAMEENQCRRFLLDYYIDCKSMKQLDIEYGFTEMSGIYHLRKRAVKNFEKKYKK